MKCPSCGSLSLEKHVLEPDLSALKCSNCSGLWIQSFAYWKWLEVHRSDLTPPSFKDFLVAAEDAEAKTCPECQSILVRFKVGSKSSFSIERCGFCAGVWLDKDEWEQLRSQGLHDEIHRIFSFAWQKQIREQAREKNFEDRLTEKLGNTDYQEAKRVKAWIQKHPHRRDLLVFLNSPDA
jgi:Zn-finger nucleic acid-binding protein